MNCISNPSSTTNKATTSNNSLGSFIFNNNLASNANSNTFNKKNSMHGNFASTFVCTSQTTNNMGMMFNPGFSFPQNCTTPTNSTVDAKSIIIENIISGKDKRTTIMLRNIPLKYNIGNLTDELNISFAGKFDFINMPINLDVRRRLIIYIIISILILIQIILFN